MTDANDALLKKVHDEVQKKVDEYSSAGGIWGKPLPLNPDAPFYPLIPTGDSSALGFVDALAKFGRYGVYMGGAYGGGHITPTFKFEDYDLTDPVQWDKFNKELNRYLPEEDGHPRGEFYVKPRELAPRTHADAIAETHDLLQQEANLRYSKAYREAGAKYQDLLQKGADAATLKEAAAKVHQALDAAVAGQKHDYAASDGWITYEFNQLVSDNPYVSVLKNIGRIVFINGFGSEYISQVDFSSDRIGQELGQAFGSKLGGLIAGEGYFKHAVGQSIGSTLGKSIAHTLIGSADGPGVSLLSSTGAGTLLSDLTNESVKQFGVTMKGEWNGDAFKGLSGFLLAEAAQDLGLKGFDAYVATEVGKDITGYVIDKLIATGPVTPEGFAQVISKGPTLNSIGGFFIDTALQYETNKFVGSLLGSIKGTVSMDNRYEGYFAEANALAAQAIGTYIGTQIAGKFLGSIIGEAAGAIGYVLGSATYEILDTLTFGLLDDWFTPDPVGINYTEFNSTTGLLETDFRGSEVHWDRNGSSRKDFVKLWGIANGASDAFTTYVNGVIQSTDAHVDTSQFSRVAEGGTRWNHAAIGYHNHAFQVGRAGRGQTVHSQDINAIVSAAIEYEFSKLLFNGGDLAQIRAIDSWKADTAMKTGAYSTPKPIAFVVPVGESSPQLVRTDKDYILSTSVLGSRIQTAQDYRFYLDNVDTINFLMTQEPNSPFTVGWIATLAQAHTMGLDAPYRISSPTELGTTATNQDDKIYAADGADWLEGGGGNDLIKTYGGNDRVGGGVGNDTIYGGMGNDTISGAAGDDSLMGDAGNDIVYGDDGNDTIKLGNGNDTVRAGAGNDTVDGGAGLDIASLRSNLSEYKITRDGDRLIVSGPEGTDVYTGVELLITDKRAVYFNTSHRVGTFDEDYYLAHNPDVAAAIKAGIYHSGYEHYLAFGKHEGRMAVNSINDPYYNESYYLALNPDVATAVYQGVFQSGYEHYQKWGKAEGRQMSPWFDAQYYLDHNKDVKDAGFDAQTHYNNYGWKEGRSTSPYVDMVAYLKENPDIAAAHINPLYHFVILGQNEGRTMYATTDALPLPLSY